MFPMTMTIHTQTQLLAVLAALSGDQVPTPVEKPKPQVKPAPEVKEVTLVVTEAKAEAPKDEPKTTSTTPVVYDDAAKAVTRLSKTKGRDAAIALLGSFGWASLKEAKPEQYAEVIAAAEKAMV